MSTPTPSDLLLLRLGHRINALRREVPMSREDLAQATCLSLTTIHKTEHGTRDVRLTEIVGIARALNYPTLDLIREALKGGQ